MIPNRPQRRALFAAFSGVIAIVATLFILFYAHGLQSSVGRSSASGAGLHFRINIQPGESRVFVLALVVLGVALLVLAFWLAIRDAAEREAAHSALQEAEAKYRDMFENSPVGIFQSTIEGQLVSANPALARIFGYSHPDEMIADRTDLARQSFLCPEERDAFLHQLTESNELVGFEHESYRKDGTTIWVSEDVRCVRDQGGRVRLLEGTVTDITPRMMAEQALRDSEAKYRLLFHANPQPMWVFDLDNLRFLDVNDTAIKKYGYSRREFLGMTLRDIRPPEDVDRLLESVKDKDKLIRRGAYRHRTKDGTIIQVEINEDRIAFDGKPAGLVVVVDVTERHKQEEIERKNRDLDLRNREIERANRLKSQFLASMSHELRTPLNAILGFSELLSDTAIAPLNVKQSRWVDHIRKAGKHLLQLINDILDLSKIEAGQLDLVIESFEVAAILPEVISNIRPLAMTKQIRLALDCGPHLHVRADKLRLKQVLYNLLSNAVKFTGEGGEVRVEAESAEESVAFVVSDTGVGMRAEDLDVIFEEFRQVGDDDKMKEGTGLGLAITRRLLEQQGGEIRVESQLGVGTRMNFTVPRAQLVVEEPLKTEGAISAADGKPLILVVDDDPAACELLASYLRPEGYDIVSTHSGREAIELASKLRPAAITLDILMSNGNGWEALSEFRSDPATQRIPIIVVSVVDQKKVGTTLGAADYLIKPVERQMLLEAVRKHAPPNPGAE